MLQGILAIETENGREAARDFLLYIYELRDELLGQMVWITAWWMNMVFFEHDQVLGWTRTFHHFPAIWHFGHQRARRRILEDVVAFVCGVHWLFLVGHCSLFVHIWEPRPSQSQLRSPSIVIPWCLHSGWASSYVCPNINYAIYFHMIHLCVESPSEWEGKTWKRAACHNSAELLNSCRWKPKVKELQCCHSNSKK